MLKKISPFVIFFVLLELLASRSIVESATLPSAGYTTYFPLLKTLVDGSPTWLGLDGGTVQSLAIDPQNPAVLYLGTWGSGIFKSVDAGVTWAPASSGLSELRIQTLAIDPRNSSVVYASAYKAKLYKSTNAGATWVLSSNGIQASAVIYSIAFDPSNSSRVLVSTRGIANVCSGVSCPPWAGIIYLSEDAGATWTPVVTNVGGAQNQFWAYSVAFDPLDPTKVLAAFDSTGGAGPGLLRSLDGGRTWGTVTTPPSNPIGRAVVFDPTISSPITAYYAGWQSHQYPNAFKSVDAGDTWSVKNSGIGGIDIFRMGIANTAPATIYLVTLSNGVLKSTDGGNTWTSAGLPVTYTNDIAINPLNNNVVYVGAQYISAQNTGGVYKSTNAGNSWTLSSHGLNETWATSLLVSPADPNHLYMSTYGKGIIQSTDGGSTWTNLSAGLQDLNIHTMVMNPANPNILFALTDTTGLYRYDAASGGSWVRLAGSTPAFPQNSPGSTPPASYLPPNYPFAVPERPDEDVHPELYASAIPAAAPLNLPDLAIAFAPSNPDIGYLGTAGDQVYLTTNNGSTWVPAGLSGSTVWSLTVDPGDPNHVFAATSSPGSIKVSLTAGAGWSDLPLPDPNLTVYSLNFNSYSPYILYAGTSNGAYQLVDGQWTALGLAGQTVTVLAANPIVPGYLYAGTTNGAFISIFGGSWLAGPATLGGLTIQGINFDPFNSYQVYYSVKANGALRDP